MLADSIIQTLKYSDHFGFPLTPEEIHLRLTSSEPCSLERVFGTLRLMLSNHQVEKSGKYYHLPGRVLLVPRRLKNAKLSLPMLGRARHLAIRLGKVAGVVAVYLTGSLAVSNSTGNDDIDFMIITRVRRLWTTRLLLTIYTELLGLRRHPHASRAMGKLCLNLYLTPDSYLLPKSKQSLYTAYELIQAVPLYDPHNTHSALLAANHWIKNYLPNFPLPVSKRSDLLRRRPQGVFSRLQNTIGRPGRTFMDLAEYLFYHLQLSYMRPKLTREYITNDSAFFHPNDPGSKVMSKLRV